MIAPIFPANEKLRQAAVEKYQLLDTESEESYDNITALMTYVCDTPISLVTLLDKERNFLKSHHGIPFNESPREISFCGHAINSEDVMTIVEDARLDERFHDNPLVTDFNAVFYAGVPLVDSDGFKLGTLCVYDVRPRQLTENQIGAMVSMAKQVMHLLEQRYQNLQLVKFQDKLTKRNDDLERFAGIVSHDLKSPLSNIIALTELLEGDNKGKLDAMSLEYLEHLKTSSNNLKKYIDGLLEFYRSDNFIDLKRELVKIPSLIGEVQKMLASEDKNVRIHCTGLKEEIHVNKAALMQVLMNLIGNALKYNSKSDRQITLKASEDALSYSFAVMDNGDGIAPEYIENIFDLFTVGSRTDRYGNVGTGIGLATVKKMVHEMGGSVAVESIVDAGSTFKFSVRKA